MRCIPCLRSLPNVAFKTVPVFIFVADYSTPTVYVFDILLLATWAVVEREGSLEVCFGGS